MFFCAGIEHFIKITMKIECFFFEIFSFLKFCLFTVGVTD